MSNTVDNPLVSICVLAYNAEETILDTLNSLLTQGKLMSRMEVLIGDDASSDRTIDVAIGWKKKFENKFGNIQVHSASKNKGVSCNFKNLIDISSGKWIKVIAADDLLVEGAIEAYLKYASENQSEVVFGLMECFDNFGNIQQIKPSIRNRYFFELSPDIQYKYLLNNSFNIAPSSFISRDTLIKNNLPDIKYRNFEDLPMWLKLTSHGVKMSLLECNTVRYRIGESLSNSRSRLVNPVFYTDLKLLYRNEIWPNQSFLNLIRLEGKVKFLVTDILVRYFNNRANVFTDALFVIGRYFKPSNFSVFFNKLFYRK